MKEMFQKDQEAMPKMVRFFEWWNNYVETIQSNKLPTEEIIDNLI